MTSVLKRLPLFAASLALAAWVATRTDWSRVNELVADGLHPAWLALLVITSPVLTLVSAWKWRSLLAARGQHDGLLPLSGLYVIGQFYSNVLPSSGGGDVVRAELTRRRHGDETGATQAPTRSTVYAAITAERFTGLFVLLALTLAVLATTPRVWNHGALTGLTLAGFLFATTVMAAVASRRVGRAAARVGQRFSPLAGPAAKLQRFQADLWAYSDHRRALAGALLQSAAFYALIAASIVAAGSCFGVLIDLRTAVAATGLVLIISLLPISINGVGLWEFAFSEVFDLFGYGRELGLAIALLIRLRDVAWSTSGYLLASLLLKRNPSPRTT